MDTEETELKYDVKQDIFKVSKYLPTRYLLITKGETVTTVEKSSRYHLVK